MIIIRFLIALITSPYWVTCCLLLALSGALDYIITGKRVRLTLEEQKK